MYMHSQKATPLRVAGEEKTQKMNKMKSHHKENNHNNKTNDGTW